MHRTPNIAPLPFTALDQLASAVALLIDISKLGKWEQLEALLPTVSNAVEVALKSPLPSRDTEAYRTKLTEILAMHEDAILRCKIRMNDITSLIEAFSESKNTTPRP